jgi:hypothetical protein
MRSILAIICMDFAASVIVAPMLIQPATGADLVKSRFDAIRAGTPSPTPSSSCWPMVAPYIYRVQGLQLLQAKGEVLIL